MIDSRFVSRLINADQLGGRVISVNEDKLVIYDCAHWSEQHTKILKRKYRNCCVDVMQSEASLSNFMIILERRGSLSRIRWLMFFGLVSGGIGMVCSLMLNEMA